MNNNFEVYPNPTTDGIKIFFEFASKQHAKVEVIDATGTIIFSDDLREFIGAYRTHVSLRSHAKGLYFVRVIKNDRVMVGKITYQ